jgi:hypothetical protein
MELCGQPQQNFLRERCKLVTPLDVDSTSPEGTGVQTPRPAMTWRTMPVTTSIPATAGPHWAYGGMSELLAHRHYDTFEPDRLLPGRLAISFSTDREGTLRV